MEYKGPVTSFLGLNIIQDGSSIAINQIGYIEHILQRFQMDKAKPVDTPLNPSLPLRKAATSDKWTDPQSYQELTGSLNHAQIWLPSGERRAEQEFRLLERASRSARLAKLPTTLVRLAREIKKLSEFVLGSLANIFSPCSSMLMCSRTAREQPT